MNLKLITLNGERLNRDVYEVVLPTVSGEIAVYPGHEPLVTVAQSGVMTVRFHKEDADGMREVFAINGGVVEVAPDSIRILVDDAEAADEIVQAEAEAALRRAQEMRDRAGTPVELEEAHELIARQTVRLKVANLRRHHRR